jgi:hypothetical protein
MRRFGGLAVLVALCLALSTAKLVAFPGLPWAAAWAPLWLPFVVFTAVAVVMLQREVAKVRRAATRATHEAEKR